MKFKGYLIQKSNVCYTNKNIFESEKKAQMRKTFIFPFNGVASDLLCKNYYALQILGSVCRLKNNTVGKIILCQIYILS